MAELKLSPTAESDALSALKLKVWKACQALAHSGLVMQSEGNVSERSKDGLFFVIKPSGVPYDRLRAEDMVVVSMEGQPKEGSLRPSSDTPTHLEIYRQFPHIGGIVHTHSPYATAWAQAMEPLPCYGTTHADAFGDAVPVTRQLTAEEVSSNYEQNTGKVIVETITDGQMAVLVAGHAPFIFGGDGPQAVLNAQILEKVAFMAILKRPAAPLPEHLRNKHHSRKHGPDRYYGQS